jgi:hypothetical protein
MPAKPKAEAKAVAAKAAKAAKAGKALALGDRPKPSPLQLILSKQPPQATAMRNATSRGQPHGVSPRSFGLPLCPSLADR